MADKTPARKIVRWKEVERELVARRAAELYTQGGKLHDTMLSVMRIAQVEILPANRQRELYATQHVMSLKPLFDHYILDIAEQKKAKAETPELESAFEVAPFPEPLEAPELSTPSLPQTVLSELSDLFAAAVLNSISPIISQILEDTTTKIVAQLPARIKAELATVSVTPQTKAIPKAPQKRVVLLGFRPESASKLKQYENLDLHYCTELPEVRRVMHAEAILIQAVKFSAHLTSDIKNGFEKVVLVNGGYSQLRHQLDVLNTVNAPDHAKVPTN